jgi:translation initiation factor IF-2
MSDSGKVKRLSKVAREFNIGINTIVDFLSNQGIEIDPKPNTKIDSSIYDALLSEFQSEKTVKESAQISRKEEKPIFSEPAQEEEKQVDEILINNVQEVPGAVVEEETHKEEAPVEEEDKEVKVVGKIDLESLNLKTRPGKKDKKEAAPEEKPAPAVEAEKPKEEKPKEKETETITTHVEKLEGPKVLGKIELVDEPKHQKKKIPVASSSSNVETERQKRKRRKRIGGASGEDNRGKPAGKKKPRDQVKPELTDKEIQEQIKDTLARLTGGGGKSKAAKHRRQKRDAVSEQMQKDLEAKKAEETVLKVTEFVTANELASMMSVSVNEVISACMSLGLFVSINQRLDAETLAIVAEEFGYEIQFVSAETQETIIEREDTPEELVTRFPIVTVMGHVDHGKTSLLDYIRKANVIAGEAGGITQHIGAYNVELDNGKKITFLDTPGHEAFTAMRARGAQVTDVVIVVVAADDSVMPQTKEAINHAQAAGVPIIFAINKIDKPGANPDKIKEELSAMNILVEDWGGKYQSQEISAKSGTNIEELLEKVLLESDLLELKANPVKNAVGAVIESALDKGRGYVTTVLIQAGTLRIGDMVLAGPYYGKVKAMFNERGKNVDQAGPSIPVTILGLNGAPNAGDKINVMDDEREVKTIATKRLQLQREQGVRTQKHITLDEIGRRIAIGDFKELNVIIKGDVDGSIEALTDSLLKLSTEQIQVKVILKAVGQISESDVMLAAASDAIIIGFQVRPSASARKVAEKEEIDIRLYSIIYDAIEEIKSAMEGMLAPKVEEKVVATVEIREVFKITKVGTVAGCLVQEGKVNRHNKVRIIREGIVVYTGELGSLKRFKDDVKEVSSGYECGLNIKNFNDIKVGDLVEAYEEVEVKQKLA